ncbi:MAG: hypothetical protein ACREOW_10515 [Thermodesulfobacteriota bacterium]
MADTLLDIHQLAEKYPAFKKWGIRWLLRHRRIPMVRLGRRIFFDPEDISEWLDSQKIKPIGNGGKR